MNLRKEWEELQAKVALLDKAYDEGMADKDYEGQRNDLSARMDEIAGDALRARQLVWR